MMKRTKFIIATVIILLCSQSLYAQETFLRTYPSSADKSIYSVIETDDSNLIFCGNIWTNPELTESIGTMMKIGMNGEVIDSTNYDFENGNSHFSELINPITTSGSYFLSGSQDSISSDESYNTVFLHTIDDELNILTRRNYGMWTDTTNTPWDFEILGDTTAYVLSVFDTRNSSLLNYSIIKANLTNEVYDFFTADNVNHKAITSLIIDEISHLIKVNYKVFNMPMYPWNPVANFSYDLNNVEVVMPDNEFFSQTMMAKNNNSGYFLSGNIIDLNTNQRNLGLAKYNLNDSLIDMVVFPGGIDTITNPSAGKKNILLTTNYIWVMGWYNLTPSLPCSPHPTYIMLNKLNYNLELIDQFFYGGDGVYYPRDIIETNDHHIVVVGEFFNNQAIPYDCRFYPFVLKVDNEGLIVNNSNINKPQAQQAIIIPNPGKDFLQIKLGVQHKSANLQLFDLNGRLVLIQDNVTDMQQVSTSSLPGGIYPYKIITNSHVIGIGKWVKE